jgi:hypothetical protein
MTRVKESPGKTRGEWEDPNGTMFVMGRHERDGVILSAAEGSHGVPCGETQEADDSMEKELLFVLRLSLRIDDTHKVAS